MNWEAIGAIGEVAASVAVLVSLIYIAVQLRETRREATRRERGERAKALARPVLENPELADVLATIAEIDGRHPFCEEMVTTYSLTPAQAELYMRYLATAWRALETEFLSGATQRDIEIAIRGQFKAASSRRFIEIQGWRFDPAFVAFISRTEARTQD